MKREGVFGQAKTGVLAVGDEIEAIEERSTTFGDAAGGGGSAGGQTVVRVRFHMGWVSKIGGAGSRKATQDRQVTNRSSATIADIIMTQLLIS